jgi:Fur family peroxide stress response transcriptional regulator
MSTKEYLSVLRKTGLRATPQRMAIWDYLITSDEHPSAIEIFTRLKPQFPSLSLATVYNTLDVLVGMGWSTPWGVLETTEFTLMPTSSLTKPGLPVCHKVVDTDASCVDDLEQELRQKTGFQVEGSRILYFGTCPDCQTRSNN